jgi:glycosyltransferase involved in cell wall biosynthesis
MIGSSGIGTYISELLPYFLDACPCLLIGRADDLEKYKSHPNADICVCTIPVFSVKELLAFPLSVTKRINACGLFYTPYCNIPSGIHIPVYSTIHDIVFLDVPGLASKAGTLARKLYYLHAVHRSRAVFTVSEFSSLRIRKQLHCRKPVIVTYSAVPSWLRPAAGESYEKTDTILFVGNIKTHKGLHVLLPAFLEARKNGLTSQLVIVGSAENFRTGDASITAEINDMPEGSVRFTGHVSDEELKKLYAQAKLLVQPSFYEGFGLPPLEALTLGTNALISDIPVFGEIYRDFPVTYFRTGDSHDLAQKMLSSISLPAPRSIPDTYSFQKSSKLILAAFDFYADLG